MAGFALKRPPARRGLISVVSMIDVLMILLFFFMITSTYLNLDMVPALQKAEDAAPDQPLQPAPPGSTGTLLIRIGADGAAMLGGQALDDGALSALLADRIAADPLTPVTLFPSGAAHLQDLIRVMDLVTRSGAQRVKVIRVEAAP